MSFWRTFYPAVLLSVSILLLAPFVGLLRDVLFDNFGDRGVKGVALGLALIGVAAFLYALTRIRENRFWRYVGLAGVVGLLWLQSIGFRTALTTVNVAEKIHIVQYGGLAWMVYAILRRQDRRAGREVDLTLLFYPLLASTLVGTLDEWVQWMVETRTGEIRDVGLNVFSGVCGLLFAVCLDPPQWPKRPSNWRPVTDFVGLTILVVGLFFASAHLGYWIEDPEIGRFRSWHSPEELRQVAEDRAERWAQNPPGDLSPWNLEDRFLTEAGWHNHHRNASFETELYGLARSANEILEKYYAPYLDLKEFRGTGQRRYPPHAQAKLQKKAPRLDPEGYRSPVLEHRIYTWPRRGDFLAGLLVIVGLLWFGPRAVQRYQR